MLFGGSTVQAARRNRLVVNDNLTALQGRDAEQVLRRTYRTTTALSAAAAVAATTLAPSIALALPQDGNVVEGQAEIIYGSNSVEIVQGSDRVIIEWSSFDVGVDESVNFVQPSQLASALNRVLSGQSSAILGSLTGNGQITIVNPAGIHFGATANVDVAAITATTIDIINANFMANNLAFDQFNDDFANATVTNDGSITVQDSGLAALVAPGVANNGIIAAKTGAVVLASGTAFTVDPYGDGLIQFAVNAPTTEAPEGMDALVSNSGEIYADGGTVILTAEAVSGIVDNVVNMDGVIQAQTIEGRNGQIALVGGSGAGAVNVAGTLDASGNDAGEAGGTVHVLGDQVALNVGANVDVSGAAGGGEALIGGAARGGAQAAGAALQYQQTASGLNIISDTAFETDGYTPTSDVTLFDAGATANASATVDGDGGDVVVWSENDTAFHGAIAAAGGANGGDGGFVEISGAQIVAQGSLDVGATAGDAGRVLIDPVTLNLSSVIGALNSVLGAGGTGGAFDLVAEETINVDVAVDTSGSAVAGSLNFLDENADANLTVNLDNGINLGASQTISGEATVVNVNTTANGSIQDAVDIALNVNGDPTATVPVVNLAVGTYSGAGNVNVMVNKAMTIQAAVLDGNPLPATAVGAPVPFVLQQGNGIDDIGFIVAPPQNQTITIQGINIDRMAIGITTGGMPALPPGGSDGELAAITVPEGPYGRLVVNNNDFTLIGTAAVMVSDLQQLDIFNNFIFGSQSADYGFHAMNIGPTGLNPIGEENDFGDDDTHEINRNIMAAGDGFISFFTDSDSNPSEYNYNGNGPEILALGFDKHAIHMVNVSGKMEVNDNRIIGAAVGIHVDGALIQNGTTNYLLEQLNIDRNVILNIYEVFDDDLTTVATTEPYETTFGEIGIVARYAENVSIDNNFISNDLVIPGGDNGLATADAVPNDAIIGADDNGLPGPVFSGPSLRIGIYGEELIDPNGGDDVAGVTIDGNTIVKETNFELAGVEVASIEGIGNHDGGGGYHGGPETFGIYLYNGHGDVSISQNSRAFATETIEDLFISRASPEADGINNFDIGINVSFGTISEPPVIPLIDNLWVNNNDIVNVGHTGIRICDGQFDCGGSLDDWLYDYEPGLGFGDIYNVTADGNVILNSNFVGQFTGFESSGAEIAAAFFAEFAGLERDMPVNEESMSSSPFRYGILVKGTGMLDGEGGGSSISASNNLIFNHPGQQEFDNVSLASYGGGGRWGNSTGIKLYDTIGENAFLNGNAINEVTNGIVIEAGFDFGSMMFLTNGWDDENYGPGYYGLLNGWANQNYVRGNDHAMYRGTGIDTFNVENMFVQNNKVVIEEVGGFPTITNPGGVLGFNTGIKVEQTDWTNIGNNFLHYSNQSIGIGQIGGPQLGDPAGYKGILSLNNRWAQVEDNDLIGYNFGLVFFDEFFDIHDPSERMTTYNAYNNAICFYNPLACDQFLPFSLSSLANPELATYNALTFGDPNFPFTVDSEDFDPEHGYFGVSYGLAYEVNFGDLDDPTQGNFVQDYGVGMGGLGAMHANLYGNFIDDTEAYGIILKLNDVNNVVGNNITSGLRFGEPVTFDVGAALDEILGGGRRGGHDGGGDRAFGVQGVMDSTGLGDFSSLFFGGDTRLFLSEPSGVAIDVGLYGIGYVIDLLEDETFTIDGDHTDPKANIAFNKVIWEGPLAPGNSDGFTGLELSEISGIGNGDGGYDGDPFDITVFNPFEVGAVMASGGLGRVLIEGNDINLNYYADHGILVNYNLVPDGLDDHFKALLSETESTSGFTSDVGGLGEFGYLLELIQLPPLDGGFDDPAVQILDNVVDFDNPITIDYPPLFGDDVKDVVEFDGLTAGYDGDYRNPTYVVRGAPSGIRVDNIWRGDVIVDNNDVFINQPLLGEYDYFYVPAGYDGDQFVEYEFGAFSGIHVTNVGMVDLRDLAQIVIGLLPGLFGDNVGIPIELASGDYDGGYGFPLQFPISQSNLRISDNDIRVFNEVFIRGRMDEYPEGLTEVSFDREYWGDYYRTNGLINGIVVEHLTGDVEIGGPGAREGNEVRLGIFAYEMTEPTEIEERLLVNGGRWGGWDNKLGGVALWLRNVGGDVNIHNNYLTEAAYGIVLETLKGAYTEPCMEAYICEGPRDDITDISNFGGGFGGLFSFKDFPLAGPTDVTIFENFLEGNVLFALKHNVPADFLPDGTINAQGNWWGTIDEAEIAAQISSGYGGTMSLGSYDGGGSYYEKAMVDFSNFLLTGDELTIYIPRDPDEMAPIGARDNIIGFQPGDLADADEALLEFIAVALNLQLPEQTNPDQVPGDQQSGRSQTDATNDFNELYSNPFGFPLETDLASLTPAAGAACSLVASPGGGLSLACGAGAGLTDEGLEALQPAAGDGAPPSSFQDLLDTYSNFWSAFQ